MGKIDKLIKEIKNLDKNLRFEELSKILLKMGYTINQPNSGSSHYTFRKSGKLPITIPRSVPINKAYIELVRDAIVEYESEEEL